MSNTRLQLAAKARPMGVSLAMWAFGLATTIALLALWGRAVVADESSLAEAAGSVVASGFVDDRVSDWLSDSLAAGAGVAPAQAGPIVEALLADPDVERALAEVVEDTVAAALDPAGAELRIVPAEVLDPVAPTIVTALAAQGVDVSLGEVRSTLGSSPELVLDAAAVEAAGEAADGTRGVLTAALVLGLAGMAAFGGTAIALSGDRLDRAKLLANRVIVSGLTFAVVLRLGAWAVDPDRGRSPVSDLLTAEIRVPLLVAAVGACVGSVAWIMMRRAVPGVVEEPGEPRPLAKV